MTRKKRRLYMLGLALLGLGSATALALTAFQDNIVFFYSPSQLQTQQVGDRNFRLGGLVEEGSVQKQPDGVTTAFRVTDTAHTVDVRYRGQLPDLFREGQGVVAEGRMTGGVFVAREVLAKHDENYMPPEVSEALKQAGVYKNPAESATKTAKKE
ncbi:cytochrome c maturation protein CcmE [Azospirillum melinis]|uniref:Cytochrome c-type biogenesis protein CcmE n=2 Tax=Azospirillum TaxID=191 RepID=A0A2B8BAF0_9PROT|nr:MULTISPECIES: cytochrome c maturation protein CcmE [Azospirillum]MBP2306216.1 cytochrome c-type biogenesis protein CcmE [Azospirillum melinis]MBY6264668.1 cytochrome c maturation protein CcmE [Azospirillum sp. 412522]NUB00161.1 cytochrome c maturation protein CcmE [Azospirillum melinis]PGH54915.1 cytochrome c maturation protein CcmE [Azospirillum palustre]PWC74652.1 cytochrome C biogenesis protein CcmE [Azospirillum sp. TSH64]